MRRIEFSWNRSCPEHLEHLKTAPRPNRHALLIPAFLAVIFLALLLAPAPSVAAPKMRISTENSAGHAQTVAVQRFADRLREKAAGRIEVEYYFDAQLFRDQDVVKALSDGQVDMAVPGNWQLDRYEPNIGLFLLPMFYGQTGQINHLVLNSPVGAELNRRIERRLKVKIIGDWLDLGHAHLFTMSRPIRRHEDIQGLKIRVAGGVANEMRIQALGGSPTTIAWPDLPTHLERGMVDGILTTSATIVSGSLWRNGLKFAFLDREYFPQYLPMIRESFHRMLPQELKQLIAQTWEEVIPAAQEEAAQSQVEARETLVRNGFQIFQPTEDAARLWRQKIMKSQDDIVARLSLDSGLVSEAMRLIPGN